VIEKPYKSIKSEVLSKLENELPVLMEKYGVLTIGLFGSVSRQEDTPKSDIDIMITIRPEMDNFDRFLEIAEFLEDLFGRKVDLISAEYMKPQIRPYVQKDVIMYSAEKGAV